MTTMSVDSFKKEVLKLNPMPCGAKIIYGENVRGIVGLAYYHNLGIFEYPVSPTEVYGDINNYIENMYDLEEMTLEEVKDNYFYKFNDAWYYDYAPQTYPYLDGDVEVLGFYYNEREMLKEYFCNII